MVKCLTLVPSYCWERKKVVRKAFKNGNRPEGPIILPKHRHVLLYFYDSKVIKLLNVFQILVFVCIFFFISHRSWWDHFIRFCFIYFIKIINCISWLHLIWFICFINYFNYTPLSVPIAFDDVINIHRIKSDLYLWNYPAVLARRNCYSDIRTWKKRDFCYLQTRRLFSNY